MASTKASGKMPEAPLALPRAQSASMRSTMVTMSPGASVRSPGCSAVNASLANTCAQHAPARTEMPSKQDTVTGTHPPSYHHTAKQLNPHTHICRHTDTACTLQYTHTRTYTYTHVYAHTDHSLHTNAPMHHGTHGHSMHAAIHTSSHIHIHTCI